MGTFQPGADRLCVERARAVGTIIVDYGDNPKRILGTSFPRRKGRRLVVNARDPTGARDERAG